MAKAANAWRCVVGLLSRTLRGRPPAPEGALAPPNVAPTWADRAIFSSWEPPRRWVCAERRYQPALQALAGPARDGGYLIPVEVTFVREADNPRHPNALYAAVRGRLVGYMDSEVAEALAPALDRSGVQSYTCCGLIRGGSYTATSLGVHVWPARRPCAGLEFAEDAVPGGAPASWPPWEIEGISRARNREPRAARGRGRYVAGAERWAGTS
jgi:hypothetical protein